MYIAETYIVEILAALIGLSYPFIFQIIGRIDDKYHSVNMVNMFKHEPIFRVYNYLLSVSVLLAIIIPFTKNPYDADACFQWISIQSITLIILISALVDLGLLLNLMWTYHIPTRLHNHLDNRIQTHAKRNRRKIQKLKYDIRKLKININRAPRRWYYVSDSEIEDWRKNLNNKEVILARLENLDSYKDITYDCISDLLLFSVGGTDLDLYVKSGATFIWCREQCGIKELKNNQIEYFKEEKIASPIFNTINQLVQECINKSSLNPSLTNPSSFLYSLFPQFRVTVIHENVYRCIWYNITKFERYGKYEWIESFWGWIVQYSNLWLSRPNDPVATKTLFHLQEFSDCFSAFLLSKGHYQLVLKMRRYSNSVPYINELVPSKLSSCCEHLSALEQPFIIEQRYPFDSSYDVKVEEMVKAWVKLYYLLSFFLFPKLENDLQNRIFQGNEKLKLKAYLSRVSDLLNFLESLGKDSNASMSNSYIIPTIIVEELKKNYSISDDACLRVRETLRTTLISLEDKLIILRQEEIIPNDNIMQFKETVIKGVKTFITESKVPCTFEEGATVSGSLHMPQITISADYFSDNREIGYVNFPESVQGLYIRKIVQRYCYEFLLNNAVRSYVIDFSEIKQAIRNLKIDDTFSVLCLGIDKSNLENTNTSSVYSVPCSRGIIIVMKSHDVPRIKCNPANFISLDFNDSKNTDGKIITFDGKINMDIETDKVIRYVQIIPKWLGYSGQQSQLPDIQPISTFIV